jgi:hypothetical protein
MSLKEWSFSPTLIDRTGFQKLGFIVKHIGACQLGYLLIQEINKLYDSKGGHTLDVIVYYEAMHKQTLPHNFATMQILEACNQASPMIATSVETSIKN